MSDNNTLPIIIIFIIFMVVLITCLIKIKYMRTNEQMTEGIPIFKNNNYISV